MPLFACDLTSWEMDRSSGHPQLHHEREIRQGCMSPCQKEQKWCSIVGEILCFPKDNSRHLFSRYILVRFVISETCIIHMCLDVGVPFLFVFTVLCSGVCSFTVSPLCFLLVGWHKCEGEQVVIRLGFTWLHYKSLT